ncbi:hypothetical protein C0Q70_09732 [Pomacea canaliculata]|uniref:Anaphase-promoting complex subunit 4 WD40 domain-containing protein n=1 Tax=Pomacea canaliculata TaxID=400727 RepID=A0A2T7PAM8_POMCA|nr:hypothetical protein C0Q70_09732 [Pomacea canaliculata]
MFTDERLEPVEFKSCWKKEIYVSDAGAQTQDLQVKDAVCQSFYANEVGTQTERDSQIKLTLAKVDDESLAAFLRSVEPLFTKCIKSNNKSRAFEGLEKHPENEAASVTCTHTLSYSELNGELVVLAGNDKFLDLSTFGRFDHEDWCTHKAAVGTWNLDRHGVKEDRPDSVIDSSCCVMCLQFHPENPAWLAGGSFNGEVLLWDLSQEDDLLLATSGIGDDAHREPVVRVLWITDTTKKTQLNIISIGGDGKILIWKVDQKKRKLRLIDGFVVMAQSLPPSMKVRGVRGDKEISLTSIVFSHEDSDTFLVGSESGCIFKCNIHAKGNPAGSHVASSVPLRSPVTFTYHPHHGPVQSVDCSHYNRHAFLTSSMDQCLRVYNMLQAHPVLIIEPGEGYLFSCAWSPASPTLLATTTESGYLLLYDLGSGKLVPIHRIEASPSKQPVFTLQFNSKQSQLLATGDGVGFIRVFTLSKDLLSSTSQKVEQLANLITMGAE